MKISEMRAIHEAATAPTARGWDEAKLIRLQQTKFGRLLAVAEAADEMRVCGDRSAWMRLRAALAALEEST